MEGILKSGYVCHPQQIYTLRRVTVAEGKAKGTEIIEVATAGGLQVDILPDTGLDIGQARFKGVNMAYISKNGYDSPAANLPYEAEFSHTFPGGLLYTCGLRTTGSAHRDGNEWQPAHGRYHGLSAEPIAVALEDDCAVIKGAIRETALFGCNLEVKRTIRIPLMGAEIHVEDAITNLGFREEEYAVLYHCNFGYPLVCEECHLELPENRQTRPRTPFAATALGQETTFSAPVPGEEERVFFHENMERRAALVNAALHTRAEFDLERYPAHFGAVEEHGQRRLCLRPGTHQLLYYGPEI